MQDRRHPKNVREKAETANRVVVAVVVQWQGYRHIVEVVVARAIHVPVLCGRPASSSHKHADRRMLLLTADRSH